MDKQDVCRLRTIVSFCDKIAQSLERHGMDYDLFLQDDDFYDSICMKIFQIGEISTKLSAEFKKQTMQKIYWPEVRGARNVVAHAYDNLDEDRIWAIATHDIPALRSFCEQTIAETENT